MSPNLYGFTRRDVARIKALAEGVTELRTPAALGDLDAPWRVSAVPEGQESRFSGDVMGRWAGRVLVIWPKDRGGDRRATRRSH
jgi:hypothetical protein